MPSIILRNSTTVNVTNEVKLAEGATNQCDPRLSHVGTLFLRPGEESIVCNVDGNREVYWKNTLELSWTHRSVWHFETEVYLDVSTHEAGNDPVDICRNTKVAGNLCKVSRSFGSKKSIPVLNSGDSQEFRAALESFTQEPKSSGAPTTSSISGYTRIRATDGSLLFSLTPDGMSVAIPWKLVERASWYKSHGDSVPAKLHLKKSSNEDANLAFEILHLLFDELERKAAKNAKGNVIWTTTKSKKHRPRSLPCHECECVNWYDPNGNGLCEGTNPEDPQNYCGHTILNHF